MKNTRSAQPRGLALTPRVSPCLAPPPAPLARPPCFLQLWSQPLSQPTLKLMALLTHTVTHVKKPEEKAGGGSHEDQGWMCLIQQPLKTWKAGHLPLG